MMSCKGNDVDVDWRARVRQAQARIVAIEAEKDAARRREAEEVHVVKHLRKEPHTHEVKMDTVRAAGFMATTARVLGWCWTAGCVALVLWAVTWTGCRVLRSPLLYDQDQPERLRAEVEEQGGEW